MFSDLESMFNVKICNFLKLPSICLEYVKLNYVSPFLSINCSEQDRSFSSIKISLQDTSDDFIDTTPYNPNMSSIQPPEGKNIGVLQTNNDLENSVFNLSDMGDPVDIQNFTFEAMEFSDQKYSMKYLSEDQSKCQFDGLLNYILNDSEGTFEMELNDQNVATTLENTATYDNSSLLSYENSQYINSSEFTQINQEISTTTAHQTEPTTVFSYEIEVRDQNNLHFDPYGNLVDISTTPHSVYRLSNLLDPETYILLEHNEEDTMYINIWENNSNTYLEQTNNNQFNKNLLFNGHIKQSDKSSETNIQVPNDSNNTLINSNTNMNPHLKNKHTRSLITDCPNKKTKLSKHYLNKTLKRKKVKYMQHVNLFKPVVNATSSNFPTDLSKLVSKKPYNLYIYIFPHDKYNKKFLKKTFIFEIEENTTSKTKTEETYRKITYTISSIPKFFAPKFQACEKIFFNKQKKFQKCMVSVIH